MKVLPYGARALLVQPDESSDVLALAAALVDVDGVAEVVPAARTVLVRTRSRGAIDRLPARIRDIAATLGAHPVTDGAEHLLDVVYDGPDLADVAAEVGLDPDGLVRAHCGASYVVAFCGFLPGFAYLRGLPAELHVGRLDQPRTRVPSGAVGIAGEFTGVYPRPSPGGWRLLGRSDATLWDLNRDPPAMLTPGSRVRFRPV